MSGFAWKLSLVVLVALLVAATTLAVRARAEPTSPAAAQVSVRPPVDGLLRAKRAAIEAARLDAVRTAVRAFRDDEGRLPTTLLELGAPGYLRSAPDRETLTHVHYDPNSGRVTWKSP